MEHLHRAKQGENKGHHYLGKETQNEIIHLIGSNITNNILLVMKSAKYYSIILDCTPDISKVAVIVRFVQETRLDGVYDVRIREHFLGFLPVPDSSSSTLTQVVLKFLEDKKTLLCNIRGQGYDNGANMKGKKSDLQKRISDMNKRAFYVPCSSHSLNLVVNDAAMSSKYAVLMFSTSLYDFFSSSVRRWNVLKKYLPNLSLKPLSDRRWESRIDALTPLRFQIGAIYDALVQISEEFDDSKELATELELEDLTLPCVSISRRRSKKPIHFTYEGRDETIDDPAKRYKIEFYYYLLDIVTTCLDERFNELKYHCDYFDSLYDTSDLKNAAPPDSLDTKCRNLAAILQDHESSDIDALELREELKVLSTSLKPGIGPKETLKPIGGHRFCPNVNVALRILLTLPVTVASVETGFSKLE
ncbi:zinc finger MYM-type protein 1-like [Schistocerca americana]|uniref:zinc finger MYM-type protein 1-like n=1 Tax=Schistocerca americana TaxID=7009 RepID=UPI001F4F2C76|nr:zinc finger MYM-type protein 1-like [Schistocerca americana]